MYLMRPHPIISLRKVEEEISFLYRSDNDDNWEHDAGVQDARVRNADNATRMTFSRGAEERRSTSDCTALSRANVARIEADVLHS